MAVDSVEAQMWLQLKDDSLSIIIQQDDIKTKLEFYK